MSFLQGRGCTGKARVPRLAVLLAVGALICGPLFAQADGPGENQGREVLRLSPDEAVELAIRNNLSLESTRISTETRRRASELSWNQFVPTVDVGGALLRLNNLPGGMTFPLPPQLGGPIEIPGPSSPWMVAGSVSATLNFNFAMFEDMRRLQLEYERGLISYGKARAQLERDIRKAYHNMLLLQENVALLQGSLENAYRQVEIAQANFNAGLAPELILLQAQVARENMRPVIDQVKDGLSLSMMHFAMLLGLPHGTEFELVPVTHDMALIPLDTAELISRAADGRLDILELRQDILTMQSLRRSTQHRLFTPTLSLGWNADPTFSGDPWNDPWFGGDHEWNQQSGAFRFSVGFRLNGLLPFGAERQGLRTLDDQIRLANIGLAQMIRGTEIEIHNAVLTLERIRTSMDVLEQTVVLAERSFYLTEQAYRAGLQDLFQVQNAEQSLRQARVQLHEQQFNFLNGLLDLEYSLGVPFGTLVPTGNN